MRAWIGLLTLPFLAWAQGWTLTPTPLPRELVLQGQVEAVRGATVSAQTSGRVASLLVDVGDRVDAGALLLTLIGVEQQQGLNRAQAQLEAAQARLVSERREWRRISELVGKGLQPKAELDRARGRLDEAQARLAATQAGLKQAREQLSYTEVHAPYGGVVSARHVEVGELVWPGTALLSGFDPQSLRLHVDMPGRYRADAEAQRQAWLLEEGRRLPVASFVLFPQDDPASGTARLRLGLNAEPQLVPGQWRQVAVSLGSREGLVIPVAAVVRRGELTLVRRLGDRPRWQAVVLGRRFGDKVEVLSGLKDGDEIRWGEDDE
ncbi:efflux RND transporter periplasmic adaptor subunit [Gallaecimonas sp. GXIMD4217]|uniref:efflux RND transporter periplasmic adaptor subunit n=1 Tax=Gallaecimonas sp. GXIMD4217 TaxID=3131927 RepID=UPI00311ACB28